ncbi:MAG: TRAP transporter substrate-binding protein [Rhodobacteraceae bacterium]|nr:TRAP transporter substrate-binding protein [Paracoccaceae bacterium]
MKKTTLLRAGIIAALMAGTMPALAQEITLRMHQFLPPQATVPAQILIPWAEAVGEASNGRIKVEVYSAMALGGTPPQLIDQVADGVVDIAWTLPGYTPGRFPRVEVFELPFMMTNAEATSRAYWEMYESDMADTDFAGFHMLGAWVHGPGVIHVKGDPIESIDDMDGLKLRGPTRVINNLLGELGATPIGMPVPALPENLAKGVIDGTAIPWEVTKALKIAELTDTSTEFVGERTLYTAAFVLIMNQDAYEAMPADLQDILDSVSGADFSANAGKVMQAADAAGRAVAADRGNTIITIEGDDLATWEAAAQPVISRWITEMDSKGIDGQDLLARARDLIAKNSI